MGLEADGTPGPSDEPGMELHGKYVFIAEGVRGSLAKKIIARLNLSEGHEPQKYGLGMKEIWEVSPEKFKQGRVVHTMGWPLGKNAAENSSSKRSSFEGAEQVRATLLDGGGKIPWQVITAPWTAAPNLQSVGHSAGYVPKHVAGILQPPLHDLVDPKRHAVLHSTPCIGHCRHRKQDCRNVDEELAQRPAIVMRGQTGHGGLPGEADLAGHDNHSY